MLSINHTTTDLRKSYFPCEVCVYDGQKPWQQVYHSLWSVLNRLNGPIVKLYCWLQTDETLIQPTWNSCLHPQGDVSPFCVRLKHGCVNGSQQFDHLFHHLLIQTQVRLGSNIPEQVWHIQFPSRSRKLDQQTKLLCILYLEVWHESNQIFTEVTQTHHPQVTKYHSHWGSCCYDHSLMGNYTDFQQMIKWVIINLDHVVHMLQTLGFESTDLKLVLLSSDQ